VPDAVFRRELVGEIAQEAVEYDPVAALEFGDGELDLDLLAVAPQSHPWRRRATLEIDELVDGPLLLTRRDFGWREWFDAACQVAHIRPRVLLESGAPPTLLALAQAGYGVAIVPSNARIPRGLRAVPILRRGESIGMWASVSRFRDPSSRGGPRRCRARRSRRADLR